MATQIVMDRTGDTRHNFDAKNADALLEATALCRETASTGYGVSNKCFEIPWPEPPVHRIKLTEAREITPYVWDHTDDER